ncbi:hypothetical protein [Bacillus bingmayongensis]|nr:hypothetical protein [Bacillus bingmayongensis]
MERNIKNAKTRYMKLSKKELVQLLIQTGQYIAKNNKIWMYKYYESFK